MFEAVAPLDHATHGGHHMVASPRSRVTPLAQRGSLQDVLRLMGMPERRAERGDDLPVPVWRVCEDAIVLHEGQPAQTLFVVRSGSFKCLRTKEDGYEQVVAFVQPGGLLGIEALSGGIHPVSAVALEDATVYALHAEALPQMQQGCPALHEALWRGLSRQLALAAETAEMMAAVASVSRLARFLLWTSRRMAEAGQSPRRMHLRMARCDIASLLGVAHETVSRSFTQLVAEGCLRVSNREVEILDLQALRERARNTRGQHVDAQASGAGVAAAPPFAASRASPTAWWAGAATAQAA